MRLNKKQSLSYYSIILISLLSCFFLGCSAGDPLGNRFLRESGDKVTLIRSNLTSVKRVGVAVNEEGKFTVRSVSDRRTPGTTQASGILAWATTSPGAILALAPLIIDGAVRTGVDKMKTQNIKPSLGDFNPKKLMEERICESMQAAKIFTAVETINEYNQKLLKEKKMDGGLEVTLKLLGILPCADDKLAVFVNYNVKMFLTGKKQPIWEREDTYLDSSCYLYDEFRDKEGLLKNRLINAIDDISGTLVNQIRFPKGV